MTIPLRYMNDDTNQVVTAHTYAALMACIWVLQLASIKIQFPKLTIAACALRTG
jgi:hypothetical protein